MYLFGQYGWSDEDVSEVAQHFAGGVVWRGPSSTRPDDSLGIYASLADLTGAAGAGMNKDELVIDTYYRMQLAPAVFVQPELQYIMNPPGDAATDDSLVAGLRFGVAF